MSKDRASELRRRFDAGFASAPERATARGAAILEVRAGDRVVGIRLADVVGVVPLGSIVPLPGGRCAGLAGVRGQLVPVWHLAALLRAAPEDDGRWLVLVRWRGELAGVAIARVIAHHHVDPVDGLAHLSDARLLPIVAPLTLLEET